MGRPPSIPAEKKTRIVLSVIAGELTVAEAARREKVREQSIGRRKADFLEAGKTALVAGRSGPTSREEQLAAEVADLTHALGEAAVELPNPGATAGCGSVGAVRWVIVGAAGRVGRAMVAALDGQPVRTWTRRDADLTARDRVLATLAAIRAESTDPIICVNAAAVADVDVAERDPRTATLVNAQAPGWLAEGLGEADLMVHLSTDYVFGGSGSGSGSSDGGGRATSPYDEEAPTVPLSVYGMTKRGGESAVLAARPDSYVVRTSWVFDADKPNYVTVFRDRLLAGGSVEALIDQVSRPTATPDLVSGLLALVGRRPDPGIYHCANRGQASRYDVARAIAADLGVDPALVRGIRTAQAPSRPAARPAYSVLGLRRWCEAGLPEPRPWRDALHDVLRAAA